MGHGIRECFQLCHRCFELRRSLPDTLLQLSVQPSQFLLRAFAVANVSEVSREHRLAILMDGRDRQLNRKLRAIRTHGP